MDGTNGVTECPLAPGGTRTYTFLCTQFGTTWYHSHYSDQYSDGAVGTIIINGPATSNYDTDLGTMTLSDWFYRTAFEVQATLAGAGPAGDNVLINGTNVHANGSGSYHRNTITKGKK
jgi:FtsP/CotA-like multicopper oxidase with cupredoxin domain